jgi:hypothetical protein
MLDACVVQFGSRSVKFGKGDKVKVAAFDPSAPHKVTMFFRHAEIREYDLTRLTDEVRQRLEHHGAKQKLVDKFASASTAAECVAAVDAVWASLRGGEWNLRGERGAGEELMILAEAVARVKGIATDSALKTLSGMSEADRKKIRALPKILEMVQTIERERAAASDGDESALDAFNE